MKTLMAVVWLAGLAAPQIAPDTETPPVITSEWPLPATGLPALPSSVIQPAMPRNLPVLQWPSRFSSVVQVTTPDQLQVALNSARCGEAIVVKGGIVYPPATVPSLPTVCPPGHQALLISASDWSLPSSTLVKMRMPKSASRTSAVATLTTANSIPPLTIADGACDWVIDGIEVTTASPIPYGVYPLISQGDNTATTLPRLPCRNWYNRMLIDAPPPVAGGNYVQRGADFNCIGCVWSNSSCWGIANTGMDTQCFLIVNSPGPGILANNYTSATGENIMFNTKFCYAGGITPCPPSKNPPPANGVVPPPVPCDFLVIKNRFDKDSAWRTMGMVIKNEFEVKHGCRIAVIANKFTNTWAAAQNEFIIINSFMPGGYRTTDFTFENNLYIAGGSLLVVNGNGTGPTAQRLLQRNELALNMTCQAAGSGVFIDGENTDSWTIDHVTSLNQPCAPPPGAEGNASMVFGDQPPSTNKNFQMTNVIEYGSPRSNSSTPGGTIAALSGATFGGTFFVGDSWPRIYPASTGTPESSGAPVYPKGITTVVSNATPLPGVAGPCNFAAWWDHENQVIYRPIAACEPLDWALVGFVDLDGALNGTNPAGATLAPTSPLKGKGTDGMDPGPNVAALLAATADVQ